MKQVAGIMLMVSFSFAAAAQTVQPDNIPGSTSGSFVQKADFSGKPIPSGDRLEAEGSPLLRDGWGWGTVAFRQNRLSPKMPLEFSLEKNELHFKRNDSVFLFADSITAFTIEFQHANTSEKMVFQNGYPATGRLTSQSFYEVEESGPNVHLLKMISKKIQEQYVYNAPPKKTYVTVEDWYVYDVKKKEIHSISNKKKTLLEALPAYESSIRQFSGDDKKSTWSFEDIRVAVKSLNYL